MFRFIIVTMLGDLYKLCSFRYVKVQLYHSMKVCGEVMIHAFSFTSELDGGKWPAARSCHFTPTQKVPGTHWVGDWVDPPGPAWTQWQREKILISTGKWVQLLS